MIVRIDHDGRIEGWYIQRDEEQQMNDAHDNRQTDDDMLRKLTVADADAALDKALPPVVPSLTDYLKSETIASPSVVHLSKAGVHVDGINISETIDPPFSRPRLFTTRPEVVEAMQWNGEGDLAAFQAWLWPLSPGYRPPSGGYDDVKPKLTLQVFDPQKEVQYPTLPPYADVTVHPGSWVVKLADGRFVTYTDEAMRARYDAVSDPVAPEIPPPAPEPLVATHPRAVHAAAEAKLPGDVDDRIDF